MSLHSANDAMAYSSFRERYRIWVDTAPMTVVEEKEMKIVVRDLRKVIKKCINKGRTSKEVREVLERQVRMYRCNCCYWLLLLLVMLVLNRLVPQSRKIVFQMGNFTDNRFPLRNHLSFSQKL